MSDNELLMALSEMMDKKLNTGLAENYLPSAIRYEKAQMEFDNIEADVDLLKKVVFEHSEQLQKIS